MRGMQAIIGRFSGPGLALSAVLMAGVVWRTVVRPDRPEWQLVGITAAGDTVWLDRNRKADEGAWWGTRINGPTQVNGAGIARIDCAARLVTDAPPAAFPLTTELVAVACPVAP